MRKIIKRNIEYAGSSSLKYLIGEIEIEIKRLCYRLKVKMKTKNKFKIIFKLVVGIIYFSILILGLFLASHYSYFIYNYNGSFNAFLVFIASFSSMFYLNQKYFKFLNEEFKEIQNDFSCEEQNDKKENKKENI